MSLYANQSDDVDFKHPNYLHYHSKVNYVFNVFHGIDTAKQYLSQAPREESISYETRKDGATLKNFVKRATEAFVGMIFRKQVELVGFPDEIKELSKTIDKKSNMNKFSRDLTTALVRDGKVYIAIDTPTSDSDDGDAYFSILERLNVINWRKDSSGQYTMLVYVETIEVSNGNFGLEVIQQWRVFKEDGNVELWRTNSENGSYYLHELIETEYDYIPIVDIDLEDIPPLYDITKLTVKHMNRTSYKDKYLDMAAIPVPVIWDSGGVEGGDDGQVGSKPVYVIGVDEAFVFSGTKEEADFQWRELSGSSIEALQNDLAVIEEDITSGVIRAAQSDNTTIKTATQSFYEAAESSNRVTVIANSVEIGLNKAMVILADMMNIELEEVAKVIVNKDFNAITQNTDNLRLLWEVYLGGALSTETFLNSMEQFETIDIGSVEEEIKRIQADKFKPEPKVDKDDSPTDKNMDNRTKSALDGKKDDTE